MTTYPIADFLNANDRQRLGLTFAESTLWGKVKAVYTGEKRPPKAGEWYLSGTIVEGYRAPNDLTTPYHIARLVKIRREIVEHIEN